MLLFHDGFEGYGPAFEGATPYQTASSNVAVQDSGLRPGGKCLAVVKTSGGPSGSYGTHALQATADSDVLITGFRINIPAFGVGSLQDAAILTVFSGTGNRQARLYRRNVNNTGYFFELAFLDDSQVIKAGTVRNPTIIPYGKWVYVELRVFFSNTGNVEIRIDGSRSVFQDNVATEANPAIARRWDRLLFTAGSETFKITDFYVANNRADHGVKFASFLGPVQSTRSWPKNKGSVQQWVPHLDDRAMTTPDNGVELWVLAGQSNAHGTDKSPTPVVGYPATNGFVRIYDRRHGGLQDLQAGYNNNRQFMPLSPVGAFYGPEMPLTGEVLSFYNTNLLTTNQPSRIVMVKGAQDASAIYPSIPDFTWHPDFPGNLYNDAGAIAGSRGNLKQDILDAISLCGGVKKIHVFWHQGESDGFFDFSVQAYRQNLNYLLDTIVADFSPIPIQFHVVLIHKDLKKASAPNAIDGFWWTESIRDIQRIVVGERKDCRLIVMDDIPLAYDSIHFDNSGVAVEGRRMFESWMQSRNDSNLVNERPLSDGDVSGVTTYLDGKTVLFGMDPSRSLRGCELAAQSSRIRGKSAAIGQVAVSRKLPGKSLESGQVLSLPASGEVCDGMRTAKLPTAEQAQATESGVTS